MANFNRVILAGNLTADPELRYTQSGLAVARVRLAVNERYTSGGEKKERTLFIDCTGFGKRAEIISEYMSKGRSILIEGRLVLDSWTDKDGQKRSKHQVNIDNFTFLGDRGAGGSPKREGDDEDQSRRPARAAGPAQAPSGDSAPSGGDDSGYSLDDDDIPF